MTTTKLLGICPRCAFDEYQEFRRETWAEFRGGFLAGFASTAVLVLLIMLALFGAMP